MINENRRPDNTRYLMTLVLKCYTIKEFGDLANQWQVDVIFIVQ